MKASANFQSNRNFTIMLFMLENQREKERVTFICLLNPNFIQKIRKSDKPILKIVNFGLKRTHFSQIRHNHIILYNH